MKIRLVEDNLNTHTINAFYEHFPADQAFSLAQRFEFYHTPISASWLNMIEIEFSSLARLCLNRLIPTLEKLEHELLAFFKDRNDKKINWHFYIETARTKLNRKYRQVNPDNQKYIIT